MNNKVMHRAETYRKTRKKQKWLYRALSVAAAGVVFCTTYALILPAITMEGESAHIHGADCYAYSEVVDVFACPYGEHTHEEICYDSNGETLCGWDGCVLHVHDETCPDDCAEADFVYHVHDELCWQEDTLVCTLPEILPEEHRHTEECYAAGEPVCGLEEGGHTHDESCMGEISRELTCTTEEYEGHTHGDACYITEITSEPLCMLDHAHEDTCFIAGYILDCDIPESEGHSHGDECYTVEMGVVCEIPEEGHTHTEECYDRKQLCGVETEAEMHQHTEDCFAQITVTYSEPVLICELEEADEWELAVPTELSGVYVQDLLAVAESQIGYEQDEEDVLVDATSGKISYYSRYGNWMGKPYEEWNQIFLSYCLYCAEIPDTVIPQTDTTEGFITLSEEKGILKENDNKFQIGDIIIFEDTKVGRAVGILLEYTSDDIPVLIAGDINGIVAEYECMQEDILYYVSLDDCDENEGVNNIEKRTMSVVGQDYIVTVTFDETAGIPKNAELYAEEITADDSRSGEYQEEAQNALSETKEAHIVLSRVRLFDIGFLVEGEMFEPVEGSNVRVHIAFTDDMNIVENETLDVVHFRDNGEVDVITDVGIGTPMKEKTYNDGCTNDGCKIKNDTIVSEEQPSGGSVEFVTSQFSVFAVTASEDPIMLASSSKAIYNMSASNYQGGIAEVKFYWRFEDGAGNLTSNKTADGKDIVTVTYGNKNDTVPYFSYIDSYNKNNYKNMITPDDVLDAGGQIKVETIEGYVVTGYSINCEWGSDDGSNLHGKKPESGPPNMKGEYCATASALNIPVEIDTTGQYRSNFYITGYLGEKKVTQADYGHDSWVFANLGTQQAFISMQQYQQYRYVLLIEVAPVNLDLEITKSADRESVQAGELVTYEAIARFPSEKASDNVNYLTDVVFTDALITDPNQIQSIVYTSKAGNKTTLTRGTANLDTPSTYTVVGNEIRINSKGQWEKDGYFTIKYNYTTPTNSGTITLTNTIWVVGTYDSTKRQSYAVASVNIIVNSKTRGSIRVYKTFEGLHMSEIDDILSNKQYKLDIMQDGVDLNGFFIKDSDGTLTKVNDLTFANSGIRYDSIMENKDGTVTATYYADILDLDPQKEYSVVESNYEYKDYTWNGSYTIDGKVDSLPENAATAAFNITAGETKFVNITNKYVDKIDIMIQKVEQGGKPLEGASFQLQSKNLNDWEDFGKEFTINITDNIAQHTIQGVPTGTYRLIETHAPDGYLPLTEAIVFEVDSGKIELVGEYESAEVVGLNAVTLKITNKTGYELPQTGGPGTTKLYMFSALLIAGAAGGLIYKTRRRQRG